MIAEPTGNDRLALWLRKLLRYVQSCEVTSVVGGRLMKGAHGTQIVIDAQTAAAQGGGTASVKMYKIHSEGNDKLSCKLWNGSREVGSAVDVAKPEYLRIANKPSTSHVIDPEYGTGAILFCVEPDGGTGVSSVDILDMNVDARKWAYPVDFCEVVDDVPTSRTANVDMGAVT